ncbi:MAG TPA: NAD(P)-binding domain-containing protein [Symbiobacteriaceae bacterium]|nr:NAD(P)-binding domain-containing protein [Symbiobacteriaceae bacterium]
MGGFKVAIVGAGRMGSLLAQRIPVGYRKVIISRDRAGAAQVADEVGGLASDQISAVRGCQVIFLAVPGQAVTQLVRDMAAHLADTALVVNMAPEIMTGDLAADVPNVRLAAAKILGHARELQMGARGVVVLDHIDEEAEDRLRQLLEPLGPIIRGSESMVLDAGGAIVQAMQDAARTLTSRLTALGLERHLAQVVLAGAAPGVLRNLAEGSDVQVLAGATDKRTTGATTEASASH